MDLAQLVQLPICDTALSDVRRESIRSGLLHILPTRSLLSIASYELADFVQNNISIYSPLPHQYPASLGPIIPRVTVSIPAKHSVDSFTPELFNKLHKLRTGPLGSQISDG